MECKDLLTNLTEDQIKEALSDQTDGLEKLIKMMLDALKERGFDNPVIKIAEIEMITKPRNPPNKLIFGLGTMKIVMDDTDTTLTEKFVMVHDILKTLKELEYRPDRMIFPKEDPNDECDECDDGTDGMFG